MIARVISSVLVVDDDPAFLALAARVLREIGVEVVLTVPNAAEGLRKGEEMRPDAVLVDVGLPDRSGIELACDLAEMAWRPRVVVTSADRDAARALQARGTDGAIPFIPKEELVGESLRELLIRD
jgi:DNA-binding NarL/FixJ family response regulator